MYKWDPEVGLRILQDEKITAAGGVPSMIWQMMEHPNRDKYDISSVEGGSLLAVCVVTEREVKNSRSIGLPHPSRRCDVRWSAFSPGTTRSGSKEDAKGVPDERGRFGGYFVAFLPATNKNAPQSRTVSPKSKQYGLTETSAGIVTNVLYDYARHPDSIGVVTVTHEAKIMSEDGTIELPRGQIGEMWFKGPQVIKSYW